MVLLTKFRKYTLLFYLLSVIGIVIVFYFSWIDSPRLSLSGMLPKFITNWTDSNRYENIRTGVPFVFLSFVVGVKLFANRAALRYWIFSFFCLTAVVCIAELGQLFLPLRMFDLKDIFWGSFASFFGLVLLYILYKGMDYYKTKHNK